MTQDMKVYGKFTDMFKYVIKEIYNKLTFNEILASLRWQASRARATARRQRGYVSSSTRLRLVMTLLTLLMTLGTTSVWAQHPFTLTTADDVTNGTETLYWLESNGATGFYMIAHSNSTNVSTSSMPNERELWYFMDAGVESTTQYYYIVNKSTGNYLKLTKVADIGKDNTIQLAAYSAGDADLFKFSIGGSSDAWVFYPKNGNGNYWINKKSGNVPYSTWLKSSNYGGSPDDNSKWKFVPKNDVTWAHPFTDSSGSDIHYYLIQNRHSSYTSYYLSTDGNYASVSTDANDNRIWYFVEAASDASISNMKYYYLVNANTGKYLYFNSNTVNGNQIQSSANAIDIREYTSGTNEDRYQFAILNAKGNTYEPLLLCPGNW